jgi:hypothetical protein
MAITILIIGDCYYNEPISRPVGKYYKIKTIGKAKIGYLNV